MFKPTRATTGKFSNIGLYSESSLDGIPEDFKLLLANAANCSVSKSTWSTYRTSLRRLADCSAATNSDLSFPLSESQVTLFVGFLLKENLSAGTIESYLSGLRQAHLAAGLQGNGLRSEFVKQVIRGRKNQAITNQSNPSTSKRLPITPAILALIKKHLKDSSLPKERKLLVWCIATLAFHGGFRIHEILPQKQNHFDPLVTLLNKDITMKCIKQESSDLHIIQVKLKSEKTNRSGRHTIVDIYQSSTQLCPIQAYSKWLACRSSAEPDLPALEMKQGNLSQADGLTCSSMNLWPPTSRPLRAKSLATAFAPVSLRY